MPVRHYRELLNFCLRLTKDRDLAADTLQESYARALTMPSRPIANPQAFMRKVVLNVLRDHWRAERSRRTLFVDATPPAFIQDHAHHESTETGESPAPPCWQPEQRAHARQRLALLQQAIDSLPERQREAFMLYRFEHLSHEDIAQRMGISVRMVERHVQLAMLHCKRQMQDTFPSPPPA